MTKIILIIAMILTSNIALAVQDFKYVPGSKIKARISSSNSNRIEFGKLAISQIIGDDAKYKIIADDKAQNIFLLPKVPANQTIELSLINFTGNVADLVLETKDIEGQVIRISMDSLYNGSAGDFTTNSSPLTKNLSVNIKTEEQEIAWMIRSMIADKEGKYYVTHIRRKIANPETIGLSIEQDRIYRFGKLIGARLKVTNRKSRNQIYLKETNFSNLFDSCLATSIEKKILLPKAQGFVWIVVKEQAND